MRRCILTLLTLLLSAGLANAQTIEAGPFPHATNGLAYYRLTPSTWDQAQAFAQARGGNLAKILNQNDNQFLLTSLVLPGNAPAWIGLQGYFITGNGWIWADGTPPTYLPWANGAPLYSLHPTFGVMQLDGLWHDELDPNVPHKSIIEVPRVSIAGLVNGSFELPAAAPGGFVNGSINGWSGPTGQVFWHGVTAQAALPPLVDGSQAAFVNNFAGGGGTPTSNAICQQLTDVLERDVAYTFSAFFGWRNDNGESTGSIELWAGGTVSQGSVSGGTLLASKSVKLTKGQFVPASVTFLSVSPWDHLGEKISVRLVGTPVANAFAQTNFDAAKLSRSKVTVCPGDLNSNGAVSDDDFAIFVVAYNALLCPDAPADCAGDFNHDGVVDDADFIVFQVGYDNLLCPIELRYVSQSRSVSASASCGGQGFSAPDFGTFNKSASVSCQNGSAGASQNSTLGAAAISLTHNAQAGGMGGPSSNSSFSVTFDLDSDYFPYFSLNTVLDCCQVTGSFTGPGINIDFGSGGSFEGVLQRGRYTISNSCHGGGGLGGGGGMTVNFQVTP